MELYKDILINAIVKENINIIFTDFKISTVETVEMKCYQTLHKIKDII